MAEGDTSSNLFPENIPDPRTKYPLKVQYCGECSMPLEYCEYYPLYEKCKAWLEATLPEEFEKLMQSKGKHNAYKRHVSSIHTRLSNVISHDKDGDDDKKKRQTRGGKDDKDTDDDKKKRQTRGGKGMMKVKKKAEPQGVQLITSTRSKKKKVTIVTGLATYEIGLKEASKIFSSKFSCGASVTGEDEVVIQGDVKDELFDLIPEKWPQVDEDDIVDNGEMKKSSS